MSSFFGGLRGESPRIAAVLEDCNKETVKNKGLLVGEYFIINNPSSFVHGIVYEVTDTEGSSKEILNYKPLNIGLEGPTYFALNKENLNSGQVKEYAYTTSDKKMWAWDGEAWVEMGVFGSSVAITPEDSSDKPQLAENGIWFKTVEI